MLLHLIRKEILEHMMSLRFAVACVLCFTVILTSLFVRGQEYRIAAGDYHEESVAVRSELENLSYPGSIIWHGITVLQAPNPLKVFARGAEENNRPAVRINTQQPPELLTSDERDPLVYLFPAMDLVNFVGIIMSLLAVVFGYDAICGEKARGTLRLMLSYSVPRDRVLLAKWIGGYVSLAIPFILALCSGAAVVLAQSDMSLTSGEWLKLGAVCGLALIYIATMFWMAIWVSCLTRNPATSVLVLATIWMVLVLAIPNLSPYVARALRPTGNPLELEIARTAARIDIRKREVMDKLEAYDAANGFGKNWWADMDQRSEENRIRIARRGCEIVKWARVADLANLDVCARLDETFQRELDGQISLSRRIGRLSPFSCFAMFAAEITDTGVRSKARFLDQIRGYQRTLTEYAYDEWMGQYERQVRDGGKWVRWSETRKGPVPGFVYVPPAGLDYLRWIVVDAGIVVGLGLIFFMLSYAAFLRYDVR